MRDVGPKSGSKRAVEGRQRSRWAFSGPPYGRRTFRPHSASLLLDISSSDMPRRRSLIAVENCVVAGSLGFEIVSNPSLSLHPEEEPIEGEQDRRQEEHAKDHQ